MSDSARSTLTTSYPPQLVSELIASYQEAKSNLYRGGHRLSAVEGGRFCEAAFRIIEYMITGTHTPLGETLNTQNVINQAVAQPKERYSKSVRVYIPRALRVVYDIRNSRNAAHLADEIDANLQDATLVASVLDWVLAEFVRLSKGTTPEEAQRLIEDLVTRRVPGVQDFGTFQKILRPDLRASDRVLLLLYRRGAQGARYPELSHWMPNSMRPNLRRTVRTLNDKALVHFEDEMVHITFAGQHAVESKGLLGPL